MPEIGLFPSVYLANSARARPVDQYLSAARAGTLPAVSLVTPKSTGSEENPQDIQQGEAFAASIINAALHGPAWPKTLLIWTYDEHGGYYDHVSPPAAVPPDDIPPTLQPGDVPGGYDRYGFRVPCVVVSPFAKPDYVSSVVHDHTSVLKLIETKWNLPAITRRDANAANLLDTLDLTRKGIGRPAFAEPPELPKPGVETNPSDCRRTGAGITRP